jgi:adenosine deaminase CECR1
MAVLALFLASPRQPSSFARRFQEIKKAAAKEQLYAFLYDLPKGGDLHHHMTLSYLPEMWYAAATDPKRNGGNAYYTRTRIDNCPDSDEPVLLYRTIQQSTYDRLSECRRKEYKPLAGLAPGLRAEWLSAMRLDRPGEGRNEFFEVTAPRLGDLLRDPNVVTGLLVDNMKRFGAEGVRYIEAQAGAGGFRDSTGKPLDEERGIELLRAALDSPEARATGVAVRFQAVILRYAPGAEAALERAFSFVDRHRDLWVGVNLAGREDNDKGFALRFLDTFRKLRRTYSGIRLSIHGGEVDSPGRNVRDTLLLGATRIGHGTNLISDPDTMLLMRSSGYLVEVCLVSNRLLEYTPDLSKHPFPEYLRFGIPVCLNTDDSGVWDSNMTDEYYSAVTHFDLTWDEIRTMGRSSLVYSFAEPPLRDRLLRDYDAAVAAFENRYDRADWTAPLGAVRPVASGYAGRTFGIHFPR